MLNRRYLRIKVFQTLYAYWQSDEASPARLEKEMIAGIERTYDLFLALLLAFGELRHVVQLRMEERRKKHLPTQEDLAPNMRLVEEPLLRAIADSDRLTTEAARRRVSWVGHQEIFGQMMRAVMADERYIVYMAGEEPTFKQRQAFVSHLFTEHIANNETLQDVFEGRSIHWMEELDLAATMVKRIIEGMREGGSRTTIDWSELERAPDEEYAFARTLLQRTIAQGPEHEEAIAARASNWDSDRIAMSDMILMKMALTEARVFEEIPVKVTLNEYIEIAKAYSTPKSKGFINGVLDKLFMELKADGRIRKVGRGLLES